MDTWPLVVTITILQADVQPPPLAASMLIPSRRSLIRMKKKMQEKLDHECGANCGICQSRIDKYLLLNNFKKKFDEREFSRKVAKSYSELLQKFPMEWFCTLTFRNQKIAGHEYATERFNRWIKLGNEFVYGTNFYRRKTFLNYVMAMERHKTGVIHFHVLLGSNHPKLEDIFLSRATFADWWKKDNGWSQISKIIDDKAVNSYLAKYVTKDGEITIPKHMIAEEVA